MALVDAGSGYDSQSEAPVLIALPRAGRIDLEITWPSGSRREVTRRPGIRPDARSIVVVRTSR
jgi:hypothetical protein